MIKKTLFWTILTATCLYFGIYQKLGYRVAQWTTKREAKEQNMPQGFAGTEWLMSPDAVTKIRSNVIGDLSGDLNETETFLGRAANINYRFSQPKKALIAIRFVFQDGSSQKDKFAQTLAKISNKYGSMEEASDEKFETLYVKKTKGFLIIYGVRKSDRMEVIVFSKTNQP